MNNISLFSVLFALFFSFSNVLASSTISPKKGEGIAWLKTGMPQALQQAKQQSMPMFVYWGAVWCPPCNIVKTTLFKDPEFIEATRGFISVYLDGDTEEAQKWGHELKVMGYPTLMILSPEGHEVLRLSPSNAVEDLVSTMNYSRNVWNPISDMLTKALSDKTVKAEIIRSLAMYSWAQDRAVKDDEAGFSEKLFKLEKRLENSGYQKSRAIIFMTALNLKLDSLQKDQVLNSAVRNEYKLRVKEILNNPELLKANVFNIAYEAENLVKYLTESATENLSIERINFIQLFMEKMKQYRQLKGLTFDHYYATHYPVISFYESYNISPDQDAKKQLLEYTSQILAKTHENKARQALISDASYTLFKFGMIKKAKLLITSELETSDNPYYLMSSLAYFEKEQGNSTLALNWYEKAYKVAKGPATKLQWYGTYVRNLITLDADDKVKIKLHVNTLLNDYTYMTDSFMGRNHRVLLALKKSTEKWAKKNQELSWLEALKSEGLNRCAQSQQDIYKDSCEIFYNEFSMG